MGGPHEFGHLCHPFLLRGPLFAPQSPAREVQGVHGWYEASLVGRVAADTLVREAFTQQHSHAFFVHARGVGDGAPRAGGSAPASSGPLTSKPVSSA